MVIDPTNCVNRCRAENTQCRYAQDVQSNWSDAWRARASNLCSSPHKIISQCQYRPLCGYHEVGVEGPAVPTSRELGQYPESYPAPFTGVTLPGLCVFTTEQ